MTPVVATAPAAVVVPEANSLAAATKVEAPVAAVKTTSTLENLMAAFNGESNAQARYLAFAEKAKAEGYVHLSKLFQATAMGEGVHAAKFSKLITAMKGTPKATLEKPKVGTTEENLEAALAGENHEVDKLYDGYLKQAESEKNEAVTRAFSQVKTVEAIHAALFKQGLVQVTQRETNADYYTCKVCGNVVAKLNFDFCPVCQEPGNEFVKTK